VQRIRFMSPHPRFFTPRTIAAMASLGPVCPQVHLPVQSGSDAVLQNMRRGYTRRDYLVLVERLRHAIPDLALSTDILVGFCGETAADHAQTLSLLEEVRFDHAFMFRYSDRQLTYAARHLSDDVPESTKIQRLQEVIHRQEAHTRASHQAQIGREVEVLITGPSRRGDGMNGRTPQFHSVLLPFDAGRPGDTVWATVHGSTGHALMARPRTPG
jgi:tRNA-2-methylthio-N6-dimethylallyladenosine synthase